MIKALERRMDGLVGDGIEATVDRKHRHRLTRLGWAHVYAPSSPGVWAAGEPPPRPGCVLEVLVDGATAFPVMAEALAGARRFVHVSDWFLEPSFEIVRDRPGTAIGLILAELAERIDVRVLVWSGAPVPAFHPTRAEVDKALENLRRDTRIQAHPDPHEHPFHCHHEKTMVIDGEVAFVGGIDPTYSTGDRWDVSEHIARRRIGWHDVATRLRGPIVADVNDHFRLRWRELTGEQLPAPPVPAPAGEHTVQLVRTVAEDMYDALPRGDFRVLESYLRVLRGARELIYIENQFLWAPEIVSIIAAKLRDPPTPDFRVVILLPAKANNGAEDTRGQVGVLIDADRAGGGPSRFLAATIRALSPSRDRADPLYVHAKVCIVDDRWTVIGSANLNAHSLFNDTEVCVVSDDGRLARASRIRLWSEHLECAPGAVAGTPAVRVVDERWRPIAHEQRQRRDSGRTPTHRLLELPGVSRRSGRLLGPLSGLLDDG
jgi:phosphatidylserine/phosphatidylglycerophosphate/cardiolipin synthase-like enzyme